jgi:hypothetical protein
VRCGCGEKCSKLQHLFLLGGASGEKKRERSNWLEAALLLALRRLPHIILGINSSERIRNCTHRFLSIIRAFKSFRQNVNI